MTKSNALLESETNNLSENKKQIERSAKAHWEGSLKTGKGNLSSDSSVLDDTNYSFTTRFEKGVKGTNPEELLAAAHAGCFTMAVAALLSEKELSPTSLDTKATVTMKGLTITNIHLAIAGTVENITSDEFDEIVILAKKSCVISKALNIPISSESYFIG